MMSPPSFRDALGINLNRIFNLSFVTNYVSSESPINQLTRTPYEWARMSGFSKKDIMPIYRDTRSVRKLWRAFYEKTPNKSPIDIKSHSYACFIIYEVYIRKFRQFADYTSSQLLMPFFDNHVSELICNLKFEHIVDKRNRRNKPIFRDILKQRLNVDSDRIGKKGYHLNTFKFILQNENGSRMK